MVYMYGLSDMWTDIFEDTDIVEAVLESATISLAEVYSYFLQRSSGISLSDIQDRYNTRIKLLLLGESDLVNPSDTSAFNIDPSIVSSLNLSNRPLLPTENLREGIDYEIVDGVLNFNKKITEYKFSQRVGSDGKWQFAVWMTDVSINDKWIDNSFGKLVGFTEEDAISNYKGFLEGIYYLYSNGPNVHFIERGVNLAMGMPYARETEEILAVLNDSGTGNYHVFTNTQTYEIPFGFNPSLSEGMYLTKGEVLTSWVEVNDYYSSGEWWYDVYLPKEVIHGVTPSELGKAEPGTTADNMMQTFLKHHMFQVLVTQPNSDPDAFSTAVRLVLYSKPAYTFPVFVWKVPLPDEEVNLESDLKYELNGILADTCISAPSVVYMDRGLENNPFVRGINWYNRVQGSGYMSTLLGYGDWPGNGGWAPEFQEIGENYLEYMTTAMRSRGDLTTPTSRGAIMRGWRGFEKTTIEGHSWPIPGNNCSPKRTTPYVFNEKSMTALYSLTSIELKDTLSIIAPDINVTDTSNKFIVTGLDLQTHYYDVVVRDRDVVVDPDVKYNILYTKNGIHEKFSHFANQSYAPHINDMPTTDGVIFISRINDRSWGVYWVNTSSVLSPTVFPVIDSDYTIAEEVYDYSDIGMEVTKSPVAVSSNTRYKDLPIPIGHASELAVFYSNTLKTDWTHSSNVLDMNTMLSVLAYAVFLPRSTYDTVFETLTYVQFESVDNNPPDATYSIVAGTQNSGGYTNGIHNTENRLTFNNGGTYESDIYSLSIGSRLISGSGYTIEVTGIVNTTTIDYVPLNCTSSDVRQFFAYPNRFKLLDTYSAYPLDITRGYFQMSEDVTYNESLFVKAENTLVFKYAAVGSRLYIEDLIPTSVDVQYLYRDTSLPRDSIHPVGTSTIQLDSDTHILLFKGSKYIPSYQYERSGTTIDLLSPSDSEVTIRYIRKATTDIISHLNRSTVASNGASFLMDRSRPDASYTDISGYTSNINRSGIYGSSPLKIPRRLR